MLGVFVESCLKKKCDANWDSGRREFIRIRQPHLSWHQPGKWSHYGILLSHEKEWMIATHNAMDESQYQCAGWRRSHEFCSQKSKLICSDRNQIGVTGGEMAQGDVKGITKGVKQPGEGWWICLLSWTWLWFSECDMCQNFGYFKYAQRSVKRGRNILYYILTSKWRSTLILPWRLYAWTIQENTWSGCLALSLIPVVFLKPQN